MDDGSELDRGQGAKGTPARERRRRAPWDLGRLFARILCALFAVIGAVPLAAAAAIRTRAVLDWASRETSRVLQQELGVTASYRVEMQLLPLRVALRDVVVPASDGGSAFLEAESVSVRPRIFSLLAGRLDIGDVEIQRPRTRIVLKEGKLANLSYRLPERKASTKARSDRPPFSSLGVTEAEVDLDVDGARVKTGPVDLDVFAERGPSFEIGIRAGETSIVRERSVTIPAKRIAAENDFTFTAFDEDVVCRLDLRARIEAPAKPEGGTGASLLVRRLQLIGMVDSDPAQGTQPKCVAEEDPNPYRVGLRLSSLRVEPRAGELPLVDGHVVVRGPMGLLNRFVRTGPLTGWIGFVGDVRVDGRSRLPEVRGRVRGADIQMDVYRFAKTLDASVDLSGDHINLSHFEMGFSDGTVTVTDARIDPLEKGVPITAARVDGNNISFSAMMRDLGVTPDTIIAWSLEKTRVTKVHGTISPLHIDADMQGDSKNFEVFNRAYHDPARRHMIGVRSATVRGRIGVRPNALEFYDVHANFGKSTVVTSLVSIGFHNDITLSVDKGTKIELADGSPLVDIPWTGTAEITAKMTGKANNPILTGEFNIQKFEFGGFPLGEIRSAKVRFQPLKVDFTEVHGKKNKSDFLIPTARLDFESGSAVLADAVMQSENFDVRDFFSMFLFDQDPRFEPIHGAGKVDARVHYDLGGAKDRCGGGFLQVAGRMDMKALDLFEERYDAGSADFEFRWLDRNASYLGIELDVPSMTLQKGTGTVLGSLNMRQGGEIRGHVLASSVPLSKIDSMGSLGVMVDGRASAVAEIEGTVDELAFSSHVRLSPTRVGSSSLPSSELDVALVPNKRALKVVGHTQCGAPITPPFDRAEYESDKPDGSFHVSGRLFGGQVGVSDLVVTRQRAKSVKGKISFKDLDIGTISELSPTVAASGTRPSGHLSGSLRIDSLETERPSAAKGELVLDSLSVERGGVKAEVESGAKPIKLAGGKLDLPGLVLSVKTPGGQEGKFDVKGTVSGLGGDPQVDASLTMRPMELSKLANLIPRAERVQGRIAGALKVSGPAKALRYQGGFELTDGDALVRGLPAPVTDVRVAISVDNDELRLTQASAKMGSGTLKITGSAPLRGFDLGAARAVITAREIGLPLAQGVKTNLDADLVATWEPPSSSRSERNLPRVTGNVTVRSFEYTRPVIMTADIASLAQRGKRTVFEAYDPADDFIEFDITLRANRSLKLQNNLIEAELNLDKDGLALAGTNQRFGLRGDVKIKPGGRIRLRRNEFEIRQGVVRFDDLTRIAPQVDVTAVTEYRRYSESTTADRGGAATTTTGSTGGSSAAAGGHWRITMRAHGDADKLKVDLTSDPQLAQDDIFLLLTVGLTRAELDQAQSASVGESVALETLGSISGADKAVTEAVPLIDEFRFGSAYSSKTGRTEPTVTIGKRLAKRIRANVTSGVAESREIRSNLEWQLSNRVSVEGSYDNVNDISSSQLGNLGADIRWRLEFE